MRWDKTRGCSITVISQTGFFQMDVVWLKSASMLHWIPLGYSYPYIVWIYFRFAIQHLTNDFGSFLFSCYHLGYLIPILYIGFFASPGPWCEWVSYLHTVLGTAMLVSSLVMLLACVNPSWIANLCPTTGSGPIQSSCSLSHGLCCRPDISYQTSPSYTSGLQIVTHLGLGSACLYCTIRP